MRTLLEMGRWLVSSPAPSVALDMAATHVAAVMVQWDRGRPDVVGAAQAPLADGVITPQATSVNIQNPRAVTTAVAQVLDGLPRRPTRIGLTIPDVIGKVSFVPFESVPPRATDLERLVAWQVRKTAPFRLEDSQIAITAGVPYHEHGREFVVALAKRDVVQEYEAVCTGAGAQAGIVDLASFNLINAVLVAAPDTNTDWFLMHIAPGYCTMAIIRNRDLIFFRNRPVAAGDELADLVHQTAMYYQDHLGGRALERSLLIDTRTVGDRTPSSMQDALRAMLEHELQTQVEDYVSAVPWLDSATGSAHGAACLAAPVGLLTREHGRAA